MSNPTQNHLQACKRILRYVRGTLWSFFYSWLYPSLSTHSDANWAGDLVDRRYITSIVVFLVIAL